MTITDDGSQQAPPPAAEQNVNFGFTCLGHSFRAWIRQDGNGKTMCVACDIGDLPYSAENRAGRRKVLTLLSQAGDIGGTRLFLTGLYKVSVVAVTPFEKDDEALEVLSAAAHMVLRNIPLIGMMGELLRPARPAGRAA